MHIKESEWESLACISLVQSNSKWRSVEKGVANFWVQPNSEIWCSCDRASLIWNDLLDQTDATIKIY